MHRSSESIAAIATALAKAQTELSNPEKAMVGTVYNTRSDSPQSFRYASLSSGLDIVRKTLGGQQIAVAQTTDIDRVGGTVNLTTILLHTSGEWISSDWPICRTSEISAPRRMGAALTYARRYALFTMVGIAGESDADLDGLNDVPGAAAVEKSIANAARAPAEAAVSSKPNMTAEHSAERCDQLLDQIRRWESQEVLQAEAIKIMRAKNCLQTPHAKLIENAFQAKMAVLEGEAAGVLPLAAAKGDGPPLSRRRQKQTKSGGANSKVGMAPPSKPEDDSSQAAAIELQSSKIDKSLLTFGEPRRRRDKSHLRFVATQPCLICGRTPSDPHHLRFAQPRAMGRKASDEFVVPLCRTHHRQNHGVGDERAWWKPTSIDPLDVALNLWKRSRGVVDRAPNSHRTEPAR
jgi:hypothetical protein